MKTTRTMTLTATIAAVALSVAALGCTGCAATGATSSGNTADSSTARDSSVATGTDNLGDGGNARLPIMSAGEKPVPPDPDPVTVDQLRTELVGKLPLEKGYVSQQYVGEDPYTLDDLHIDSATSETGYAGGAFSTTSIVTYAATIQNAYFRSEVTGTATFLFQNEAWRLTEVPSPTTIVTEPLCGVAFNPTDEGRFRAFGDIDDSEHVVATSSTFEETGSTWKSTLTVEHEYEGWMFINHLTTRSEFKFVEGKGWTQVGNVEVVADDYEYTISGMEFAGSKKPDLNVPSTARVSLAFGDFAPDGTGEVTYTIDFDSSVESIYLVASEFAPVHESGTVPGTINVQYANDGYNCAMSFNDSESGITITCQPNGRAMVAGKGSMQKLNADLYTNFAWAKHPSKDTWYKLQLENVTMTQQ